VSAPNPAEIVISKFGGLTKTAKALSTDEKAFAVSTVQGWQDRGRIPQGHWPALIVAAKRDSVELDVGDFLGLSIEAAE
jgi:hypothetical protein